MTKIEDVRNVMSKGIIALLWLNTVLIGASALYSTVTQPVFAISAAVLLATLSTFCWFKDRIGAVTRTTTGFALAAQVCLLVFTFTGSSLQIDMHMYFFATLAICAAWVDWRPILAFTALTAVHHLALYFVLPTAVFPSESSMVRVLLHAAILSLEAGTLWAMVHLVQKTFASSEKATSQALKANEASELMSMQARESQEQAETLRNEREQERQKQAVILEDTIAILGKGLDRLSNGDLTTLIDTPFDESLDRLRKDYNKTVQQMRETLIGIRDNAVAMESNSEQLREVADILSTRTEDQATSVQNAASAMEEISKIVNASTKRAESTNELADLAGSDSNESSEVVAEAVEAMHRIEDASKQIVTIISVIDEIAFQTNLLALNAGVEAARAGEAGSGFAVVAQEVRDLAGRSANAAKEIKVLINQSSSEVQSGVQLVGKTGEVITRITERIDEISTHIKSIAESSRQQSHGIEEMNETVMKIDSTTQQNASMAEQTNAATQELANQSRKLSGLVAMFNLGGNSKSDLAA